MTLVPDLEQVEWYGRGPGESYVDSKEANPVGRYRAWVADLFTPYVFPQENGNRSEVRWVALTDERGVGLYVQGLPALSFSACHFTTQDLEKARHRHELTPQPEITLNLDHRHCGLGSGSCGPATFEQYRVPAEPFAFTYRLRAFSRDEAGPEELYGNR